MVAVALAVLVVTLLGFTVLSVVVALASLGVAAWAAWAPRPSTVEPAPAEVGAPDEPVA
jgi:hypothetical protein